MKKGLKITFIVLGILIGFVAIDTIQAIVFNNSPIIKVTKTYSSFHKKNIGILVETDIYDGVTQKTRFKWEAHTLPIMEHKNVFEIGEKSDIQISQNLISLSVKDGTLKDTGVTLILKNDSNKLLRYDEVYELEKKQDNEWHKINMELPFNEPLWDVGQAKFKEIDLKWEQTYGKLEKGEYRIIKEVYFEKEVEQKFYIAAEFVIES